MWDDDNVLGESAQEEGMKHVADGGQPISKHHQHSG